MNTIAKVLAVTAFALLPRAARAQEVVAFHDDPAYCGSHWWGVGRCWHRVQHRPVVTLGGEFGVGAFVEGSPFGFGSGTGSVVQAGPAWGLRAGVDFLPWLGIEGRYVGMYNGGNGSASGLGYVMTGGEIVLRLAVPTPYVRPYIFGGVGYYDFSRVGTDPTGASALVSSSQPGFPMGVGLEVPLTWHVSFAVEGTFRFQLGESFAPSKDEIDGADQTTLTGIVKVRL